MTKKETLDDLRARSQAVRDSSREAMAQASENEKTLSDTLDRANANNDHAKTQETAWPKAPES